MYNPWGVIYLILKATLGTSLFTTLWVFMTTLINLHKSSSVDNCEHERRRRKKKKRIPDLFGCVHSFWKPGNQYMLNTKSGSGRDRWSTLPVLSRDTEWRKSPSFLENVHLGVAVRMWQELFYFDSRARTHAFLYAVTVQRLDLYSEHTVNRSVIGEPWLASDVRHLMQASSQPQNPIAPSH